MPQTQSPTNKLYAAAVTWLIDGTGGDKPTHIALEEGSMSGFGEATNALTTESTKSGLTRASATLSKQQTTVANDTARSTKTFTAGETATIVGAGAFSASSSGNMLAWVTFNASIALESSDTLAVTFNLQFKKD